MFGVETVEAGNIVVVDEGRSSDTDVADVTDAGDVGRGFGGGAPLDVGVGARLTAELLGAGLGVVLGSAVLVSSHWGWRTYKSKPAVFGDLTIVSLPYRTHILGFVLPATPEGGRRWKANERQVAGVPAICHFVWFPPAVLPCYPVRRGKLKPPLPKPSVRVRRIGPVQRRRALARTEMPGRNRVAPGYQGPQPTGNSPVSVRGIMAARRAAGSGKMSASYDFPADPAARVTIVGEGDTGAGAAGAGVVENAEGRWVPYEDPSTNKTYYHNETNGQTSRPRPPPPPNPPPTNPPGRPPARPPRRRRRPSAAAAPPTRPASWKPSPRTTRRPWPSST